MARDKEIYFEQYKLYVEGIEKISDRRDSANKYFITLNSSILVLAGFIVQYTRTNQQLFLIGLCALGLAISVVFWFLINAYRQLNTGKFEMVHKIEEKLPLKLYKDEWKILGEGKDKKKYFPFSHIERLIPVLFACGYLAALTYLIFWF